MRNALWMPIVLAACGVFNTVKEVKDDIKGVTDPTVAQALILSVQEPQDPNLQLALQAARFESGTGVNAFLSNSITEPESSPLKGADVTLHGSQSVPMTDDGGGAYSIAPGTGLTYGAGEVWEMEVGVDKEDGTIEVELPEPADLDVPLDHPTQADLVLDFAGQGFQSVLVVVIDGTGQVTYTNEPQNMSEALDFAGKGDDLELFVVPGTEAFAQDAMLHAVGIAGLRTNLPDGVENMNTLLSGLQAGEMVWHPVSTVPVQ